MFESLLDLFASVPGTIKSEPPSRAVVDLDERRAGHGQQVNFINASFFACEEEGHDFCGRPISVP